MQGGDVYGAHEERVYDFDGAAHLRSAQARRRTYSQVGGWARAQQTVCVGREREREREREKDFLASPVGAW